MNDFKWKKRSELKPGEMFATDQFGSRFGDLFVVIDEKTEVGFWRGGVACFGDIAPSVEVLVIS